MGHPSISIQASDIHVITTGLLRCTVGISDGWQANK